jgi:hypothetical protein
MKQSSDQYLAWNRLTGFFEFIFTLLLCSVFFGCASSNINPAQPRTNTGYVDFYSNSTNLSWQVMRFDEDSKEFKNVFTQYGPLPDRVLRLALAPGQHRLQVLILNRIVQEPAEVAVEVQDGKVTPVRIKLIEAGTSNIQTKETSAGGTAFGRYGRRTKFRVDETATYQLSATADSPVDYQVKERMPYAH